MPMMTMTAAEIAAAELAAAELAAAHAAQVAAAQTLAAEQAAALTAQQAAAATANTAAATATNAATNQSVLQAIGASPGAPASAAQLGGYGGINSLGAGAGAGAGGGISSLGAGAGTGANLGYDALAKEVGSGGIENLVNAANYPLPSAVPTVPSVPNVVTPGAEFIPPSNFGPASVAPPVNATPVAPPPPPLPTLYGSNIPPSTPPTMGPNTFPDFVSQAPALPTPPAAPSLGGPGTGYQGSAVQIGSGSNATPYTSAELQTMYGSAPASEPNFLQSTWKEFKEMSLPNKLLTGMMGATGYEMLNKPKPYEKEKYKSTFKPGLYSGYTPVQPTPYQPNYAAGGIADLGGYSDGGRMLKGPGDGMSDGIPAVIAGKQPAKLANEEFVVPADVVSHLGNGSSEAGAKVLYKMMDRVRQARTGTKKQGKQINPEKYLA